MERTGTGRQFPPSLASLSATKFSLQIYMELTKMARPVYLEFTGLDAKTKLLVLKVASFKRRENILFGLFVRICVHFLLQTAKTRRGISIISIICYFYLNLEARKAVYVLCKTE